MSKENLKDKLDGNELDLSLGSLEVVPVKEIAAVPKATHLDLSCNLLTKLPADFTTRLNYIIKLDLSKNQLTVLPDNFGTLQQLQTLDLFSNKLQNLPVSFGYLKKLKWLDVKDNPLREPVASVAGDCLDDAQCRNCAKNVVQYMRKVLSDGEREKQKRLKEEREKEAARKQAEEREMQRKKAEKKREREEKRRQYEAQQAAKKPEASPRTNNHDNHAVRESAQVSKPKKQTKGGLSCCGVFIAFLLGLVAVGIGLYFYCDSHKSDAACRQLITWSQPYYKKSSKFVIYYGTIARDSIITFGSQAADVSVTYLNATKAFLINSLQKLQETVKSWSDSKS